MEIPYCDINAGRLGYSTRAMNPPPAEKKRNVIQFELTEGCSHNSCTFCNMYNETPFRVKSIRAFKKHVDAVISSIPLTRLFEIERIFIGSGNALSADTNLLLEATQYALLRTKKATGKIPKRLSIYGNTQDILKKGRSKLLNWLERSELDKLNCGGVCNSCSVDHLGSKRGVDVLYWGVESGNSDVLKMAGKGYDKTEALEAANLLMEAGMRPSIMIIPGLGGIKYFDAHIEDTIYLLNHSNAEWITFIGLNAAEKTPYSQMINREELNGTNRNLTPAEIVEQTARIIRGLDIETRIGVFGKDVHSFGYNPIPIGSHEINSGSDARRAASILRTSAALNGLYSSKLEIEVLSS
jgi:radical SAM superfamily enzyme YgiQ (UPF0313 family)